MFQVMIVPLLRLEMPGHPTIAPLSGGSVLALILPDFALPARS